MRFKLAICNLEDRHQYLRISTIRPKTIGGIYNASLPRKALRKLLVLHTWYHTETNPPNV
jgi:hypothetical protein